MNYIAVMQFSSRYEVICNSNSNSNSNDYFFIVILIVIVIEDCEFSVIIIVLNSN